MVAIPPYPSLTYGTISTVKDLEQPVEPREVSVSSSTTADTRVLRAGFPCDPLRIRFFTRENSANRPLILQASP
jgi:hypothetical protein